MGLGGKLFSAGRTAGLAQGAQRGTDQMLDLFKQRLAQQFAIKQAEDQRAFASAEADKQRTFTAGENELSRQQQIDAIEKQGEVSLFNALSTMDAQHEDRLAELTHQYGLSEESQARLMTKSHEFRKELQGLVGSQQMSLFDAQAELEKWRIQAVSEEKSIDRQVQLGLTFGDMGMLGEVFPNLDPNAANAYASTVRAELRTRLIAADTQSEQIPELADRASILHDFAVRQQEAASTIAEMDAERAAAYRPHYEQMARDAAALSAAEVQLAEGRITAQELQQTMNRYALSSYAYDRQALGDYNTAGAIEREELLPAARRAAVRGQGLVTQAVQEIDNLMSLQMYDALEDNYGITADDIRALSAMGFGRNQGSRMVTGVFNWAGRKLGFDLAQQVDVDSKDVATEIAQGLAAGAYGSEGAAINRVLNQMGLNLNDLYHFSQFANSGE